MRQNLQQGGSKGGRIQGDMNARRSHGVDFRRRVTFTAADDGARMPHAPSRRRRHPGNKTYGGLFHPRILQKIRSSFFRGAADFADHDDLLRFRIGQKPVEYIDEFRALDRIAADPDAG